MVKNKRRSDQLSAEAAATGPLHEAPLHNVHRRM